MHRRASFIIFVFLSLGGFAWAGPPFLTDDPEPVELHHWEIYTASQHVETKDGWSGVAPSFDINYGILPNAHLHFLLQNAYDAPFHDRSHYGVGDSEVGAKIRIVDETPRHPQAAIYPAVDFPTGDEKRGLGAGRAQAFLPLWIQKTWKHWASYGGGGYWINPGDGRKNWIYLGWAAQYELTERLMLGGEMFHRTSDATDGVSSDGFNVGGGYDITDEYHLLVSAGRDVTGPNRFTTYLAIQWTFPPEGKPTTEKGQPALPSLLHPASDR